MSGLPNGWVETTLGELTSYVTSGSREWSKYYSDDGALFIRTQDIASNELADLHTIARMKLPTQVEGKRSLVSEGDLLVTITGYIGRCVHIDRALPEAYVSQSVALVRLTDPSLSEFIYWQIRAPRHGSDRTELELRGYGLGRSVLSLESIKTAPVWLAPLTEQTRIVAKLGAHAIRTARARVDLDRVPALAGRYKRAVLGSAFNGLLTAKWRADLDTGESWTVATLGDVTDITSGYGFPKNRQGKTAGDFPFAKVSDISRAVANNAGLLSQANNYVSKADLKTLRAKPVPAGTVVFAKIGEALRLNRRALATTPLILDNNCMALTPRVERIDPRYLLQFMWTVDLSPFAVATAVPSVRRGDVASIVLPLPPISEQREIVRRVDAAFAEIDRLTAEAAAAHRLLDRLDQAVLGKAFRGELVPQDPTDEPASVLLERIRAQRAAAPKAKRGRAARAAA